MLSRVCVLSLVVWCGCLTAATPQQLRERQHAALDRGDVLEAVRLGRARVKASPASAAAHYNLACALARAGNGEEAVASLRAAVSLGFDAPGFLPARLPWPRSARVITTSSVA